MTTPYDQGGMLPPPTSAVNNLGRPEKVLTDEQVAHIYRNYRARYVLNVRLRPGDFGLTQIAGPLGKVIAVAQLLIANDGSKWTHAFLVVSDSQVIEAMPRGARLAPLANYLGRPDVVWSAGQIELNETERIAVAAAGAAMVGVKYSFADYLALALVSWRFKARWVRRYVARSDRMICSQLVDEAYRRSGVHLFRDGRLSQDVTPGDLANLLAGWQ